MNCKKVYVLVQQCQVCFSSVSSYPDTMKPKRFHTSDLKTAEASAISHTLSLGSLTARGVRSCRSREEKMFADSYGLMVEDVLVPCDSQHLEELLFGKVSCLQRRSCRPTGLNATGLVEKSSSPQFLSLCQM